jgi:GNAT superfamily N-acetyltransferase
MDHAGHPRFDTAYAHLEREFGERNELETRDVLLSRLDRSTATVIHSRRLRYEMFLATESSGEVAAVRDHTLILPAQIPPTRAVVHLSHVWVAPAWRRTGLAAWLRALPAFSARRLLAQLGGDNASSITLVAEMEHPEPGKSETLIRLKAYGKAGFSRIELGALTYEQPDFRPPEEIDRSGGPRPLPFLLLIRRVGSEGQSSIDGSEVRLLVEDLYSMYAAEFRPQDMSPMWERIKAFPGPGDSVQLVSPYDHALDA